MTKLIPLRSTLGPPAEGADKYFARDKVVKKITRKLNLGGNLLLSAPRRIGKSSILKYLLKNPQSGQIILYLSVMSIDSSEGYFKQLFTALIKNPSVFGGVSGYFTKANGLLSKVISRIAGVSLAGSVTINPQDTIDYYQECLHLIEALVKKPNQVIVFIDELPDALNNIRKNDVEAAIRFLQQNRDLRMAFSNSKVQFVYTGSTGLKNVVKRLGKLDLVNDLVDIQVPPLSFDEAKMLIKQLVLGYQLEYSDFVIADDVIDYLLDKITWRLPYYMQVITSELFDYFDDCYEPEQSVLVISTATIDEVLDSIVRSKSTIADYFENWKRRLTQAFDIQEHAMALDVLNDIATNGAIEYAKFHDFAVKHKVGDDKYVLNVLQHDGYISEDNQRYGFNSFLLKQWWFLNVAK